MVRMVTRLRRKSDNFWNNKLKAAFKLVNQNKNFNFYVSFDIWRQRSSYQFTTGNETGLGNSLYRLLFIKGPRGYVLSPSGSSGKQKG